MRGTHCDSLVNFTRESRIVRTLVSMSSMFTSRSKYFWYSSLIRLLSSSDPLRSSSWNISWKIYSVFLQHILSCNFLTTFSNICSENLGKFSGQFLLLFIQSLIFAFFFEIFWQLLTKCQISLHRVAIEGEIKNLLFCTLSTVVLTEAGSDSEGFWWESCFKAPTDEAERKMT